MLDNNKCKKYIFSMYLMSNVPLNLLNLSNNLHNILCIDTNQKFIIFEDRLIKLSDKKMSIKL